MNFKRIATAIVLFSIFAMIKQVAKDVLDEIKNSSISDLLDRLISLMKGNDDE